MKPYKNYDKYPEKKIEGFEALSGWNEIAERILFHSREKEKYVVVLDCYTQVNVNELLAGLKSINAKFINAEDCCIEDSAYNDLIAPYVTDDRVFGVMNTLTLGDIYLDTKLEQAKKVIDAQNGLVVVYGVGASLLTSGDLLIYLDLARREIEMRFACGATNWKTANADAPYLSKFKQGFFVEWRMADRHKRTILNKIDYLIDTNIADNPKMVSGAGFRSGLERFAKEPFRLVPYFAPEVWGGQWMKEVCSLNDSEPNYAWAFDGVVEENSIYMSFNGVRIEVPSINVVFYRPVMLLGNRVHARFGDEFPIRFDFLDTMGGQNLSLQVHPLTEYIQHTFGMHYTQDESYYILDCKENTYIYLGLKENVNKEEMLQELEKADRGEVIFDADKYINRFKAEKHQHYCIPAGTLHCSGADTMVLEISATPYIFTFKLWDWARLGLDGKPRPVHLQHGKANIQWNRTTKWVEENLVNKFKTVQETSECLEEITGLHEREFIETRRYSIAGRTAIARTDSVIVGNVVEGEGAIIESQSNLFEPFTVHYAETFIVPQAAGNIVISPISKEAKIVLASIK